MRRGTPTARRALVLLLLAPILDPRGAAAGGGAPRAAAPPRTGDGRERIAAWLYERYERQCLEEGWRKLRIEAGGLPRSLLFKGPAGPWRSGAIVALHGGGGAASNWGRGLRLGRPMERFGELALRRGFALFALESTDGVVTDEAGRRCGKRWDSCLVPGRPNVDLPFLEAVLDRTIPGLRPPGSAGEVFLTGISNGGFLTILAATRFGGRIAAFAPVSAGDPYGTIMDMGTRPLLERRKAPGVFRDRETGLGVHLPGAARASAYARELPWYGAAGGVKPPFKQFHHEGDGACDISCMEKAGRLLRAHGYPDDGPYVARGGRRSVWQHFWRDEYNLPLLAFFTRCRWRRSPRRSVRDAPGGRRRRGAAPSP